jgi:hypothetical protein
LKYPQFKLFSSFKIHNLIVKFLFRWSAKLKADAGAVLAGEGVMPDPNLFPSRHGGRRGSKKYKRRFFSRVTPGSVGGATGGGMRRRGPRRLSGKISILSEDIFLA